MIIMVKLNHIMRKKCFYLLMLASTHPVLSMAQPVENHLKNDPKTIVHEYLEENSSDYGDIAMKIWALAEVGYQEYESSKLLQQKLTAEGFDLQIGVAGMPTAFTASYGSGRPVIAILGEFDALPGVSQAAVPYREERPEVGAGHACGHHLFGSGSAAAAAAAKNWLEQSGSSGTIRFYGTPAEEGGAGKVYMVREGLFKDVDVVLHWHPSPSNAANPGNSLANKSAKFRFYGQASHAAGAPERGRSALDGVEAMNYMVNLMREHVPQETRIHYVITKGGEAPNVVPAYAEVFYYVRHPEAERVKEIFNRVVAAAEGAAQGTGTEVEHEVIHGIYNLVPNETLQKIMYKNLVEVGGVEYTAEEKVFVEKIMATYPDIKAKLEEATQVMPYASPRRGGFGSTDVGDVSWVVPTAGMGAATWAPGTSAHSWQAVAAGGTSIGRKGMMVAAKTLALTAIDIFQNPDVTTKAKAELEQLRGKDFIYESLLGDRKPPLDYRQ